MRVHAKFFVTRITHHHNGAPESDQCAEIAMAPVYGEANKDWSKWTPQGELKMTITNPAALEAFAPGKVFLLGFTPVDA